jgi:hypothetical protein
MLLVGAARGVAADPTPADKSLATELFRQGRALLDEGNVAQACRKLEESQRLDPGGGTLLNLALCHEREQRTATAWSEFTEALGIAKRDARAPRIELAETHIKALEPMLSRLVVSVPPAVDAPGLQIKRDGSLLGRAAWGIAMPVDPGEHLIEASAPGKQTYKQVITVGPNADVKTVTLSKLEDAPALLPAPVTESPRSPSTPVAALASDDKRVTSSGGSQRAAAWTSLGLGVAALGAGGVFALSALSKNKEADRHCSAGCDTTAVSASDSAVRYADFATVGVAVGAVGVGLSLILFATDSKRSAEASHSLAVGLAPDLRGGGSFLVRRAF